MPGPAESSPEDPARRDARADAVPAAAKLAYGLGGMNEMLGHWLYSGLARPVFNMHLGLSPTLVGAVLMIGRLCDGIVDPLFGWLSDNTRSRWGRRRPYLLFGSIAAGVALPLLFLVPDGWNAAAPWAHNRLFWFMLITVVLYAPVIGLFSMPYASLGSELTPDYHERTSVMAVRTALQKTAGLYIAAAWWIARSFRTDPATGQPDVLAGARLVAGIAGLFMIVAGVVSFRRVRERYYEKARRQTKTRFWSTCRDTFQCRPFVVLLAVVVTFAVATSIANDLGQYAGTYHVFGGDQDRMSQYFFYTGVGQLVVGLAGVILATWAARRVGKRTALGLALGLGALAYGASWWMYAPGHAGLFVLNASLTVVASTGLWVLAPSMCVDVVDAEERRSGQRREGAFSSWMSWAVKLSLAGSLLASGLILDATGFRAALGGRQSPEAIWWIRFLLAAIPVVALTAGLALLARYPLTEERMDTLRRELEARRGRV